MRGEIRFRMVTWVPFPGVERTFTTSMKLSMMVKPIPERSSLPVVTSGVRAYSTSAMPTPQSRTKISRMPPSFRRSFRATLPSRSG